MSELKTCVHGEYMPHYVSSGCPKIYAENCCGNGGAGGGPHERCGGTGSVWVECQCPIKINGVCMVYCPGGNN